MLSLSEIQSCPATYVLAINDTMNALSGKWKIPIIAAMLQKKNRFRDIQRTLVRITPRVLSKELRELELNGIVERCVHDTVPVLVEYRLTPSAYQLRQVLDDMIQWGMAHNARVFGTGTGEQAPQ